MRCWNVSLTRKWRSPRSGHLVLISMILVNAVSVFILASCSIFFPCPVLAFGFCIGTEFISLDDQGYARYEDWWQTWFDQCHECCSWDDGDIGCITDDLAKVVVLSASTPFCDGWLVVLESLAHFSEGFVAAITGYFRYHCEWESRNNIAWCGNGWCWYWHF